MKFFGKIILNTLVIVAGAWLMPRVHVDNLVVAAIAGLVIALLNSLVKPILKFLTIPITIVTLGLFLIVLNALMIWLAELIVPGFIIDGFMPTIVFSLVLSFITWIFDRESNRRRSRR